MQAKSPWLIGLYVGIFASLILAIIPIVLRWSDPWTMTKFASVGDYVGGTTTLAALIGGATGFILKLSQYSEDRVSRLRGEDEKRVASIIFFGDRIQFSYRTREGELKQGSGFNSLQQVVRRRNKDDPQLPIFVDYATLKAYHDLCKSREAKIRAAEKDSGTQMEEFIPTVVLLPDEIVSLLKEIERTTEHSKKLIEEYSSNMTQPVRKRLDAWLECNHACIEIAPPQTRDGDLWYMWITEIGELSPLETAAGAGSHLDDAVKEALNSIGAKSLGKTG